MSEKNAIDEELSFGIDLGIGSCGWAVLRRPKGKLDDGVIEGWGSWCFDVPETDKDRRPTNQIRRANPPVEASDPPSTQPHGGNPPLMPCGGPPPLL